MRFPPSVRAQALTDEFHGELRKRTEPILALTALFFSPVFVSHFVIDLLLLPQLWSKLLLWRIIGGVSSAAIAGLARASRFRNLTFEAYILMLMCFGLSMFVILLLIDANAFVGYFSGYQFMILASGFLPFYPLRWAIGCVTALALLAVAAILERAPSLSSDEIAVTSFMLAISVGLALISASSKYALVARSFDNRVRLRSALQQLNNQSRLAALGQLLAGLAHEIANPLNFSMGGVQQLQSALDRIASAPSDRSVNVAERTPALSSEAFARAARAHQLVQDGYQRISTLVANLRAQLDDMPSRLIRTDVCSVLRSTLELMGERFTTQGISVHLSIDQTIEVQAEPGAFAQVFTNLFVNSCLAMPTGGELHVSTGRETEESFIDIRDTGTGIPEEHRDRLFEPFFTTRGPGEGSGLGLYISLRILQRAGGSLEVMPTASGTHFRISIRKSSRSDPP
jgi:signal transduction histidine kinase